MTASSPSAPPPKAVSALYGALRALGYVMLLLILISILYSGWIAITNWGEIRV